jgi:hypothetical protein
VYRAVSIILVLLCLLTFTPLVLVTIAPPPSTGREIGMPNQERDIELMELEEQVRVMAGRARGRSVQVGKLADELEIAQARIKELEEKYEPEKAEEKAKEAEAAKEPEKAADNDDAATADGGTDAVPLAPRKRRNRS